MNMKCMRNDFGNRSRKVKKSPITPVTRNYFYFISFNFIDVEE